MLSRILVVLILLVATVLCQGGRRVALIIGNGDYKLRKLENSVGDAQALAAKLKGMGYETMEGYELTSQQIQQKLSAFKDFSKGAELRLIYFTGHGVVVRGQTYYSALNDEQNYLHRSWTADKMCSITQIYDAIREGGSGPALVVMDMCREKAGSFSNGDYKKIPDGTVSFFATEDGGRAYDSPLKGTGGHGAVMTVMLPLLDKDGMTVKRLAEELKSGVYDLTKDWENGGQVSEVKVGAWVDGKTALKGGDIEWDLTLFAGIVLGVVILLLLVKSRTSWLRVLRDLGTFFAQYKKLFLPVTIIGGLSMGVYYCFQYAEMILEYGYRNQLHGNMVLGIYVFFTLMILIGTNKYVSDEQGKAIFIASAVVGVILTTITHYQVTGFFSIGTLEDWYYRLIFILCPQIAFGVITGVFLIFHITWVNTWVKILLGCLLYLLIGGYVVCIFGYKSDYTTSKLKDRSLFKNSDINNSTPLAALPDSHKHRAKWKSMSRGGSGTIKFKSGVVNGKSLRSNDALSVRTGETIRGHVTLNIHNKMSSNAVTQFGCAWSWGNKKSSLKKIQRQVPTGFSTHRVYLNIKAPREKGTYYLVYGMSGEFKIDQVFSMSNWAAGVVKWGDGNDLIDVIDYPEDLAFAEKEGYVQAWPLFTKKGYRGYDVACLPLKIVVK